MSSEYEGHDLLDIAAKAEQDLNFSNAKGSNRNDTSGTEESGIDQSVTSKVPGSMAKYGSHTSGAGNNRDIPPEEGGGFQKDTGHVTKAGDFRQGAAEEGSENLARTRDEEHGGGGDVRNQGRWTIRHQEQETGDERRQDPWHVQGG